MPTSSSAMEAVPQRSPGRPSEASLKLAHSRGADCDGRHNSAIPLTARLMPKRKEVNASSSFRSSRKCHVESGLSAGPAARLSLLPHQPRLVPVPVARLFGFALVMELLAAAERDGDLGAALGVEIDAQAARSSCPRARRPWRAWRSPWRAAGVSAAALVRGCSGWPEDIRGCWRYRGPLAVAVDAA